MMNNWDDYPLVLRVEHVKEITGLGINAVYQMTRRKGFPAIREGRSILIPRDTFRKWMEEQRV